MDDKLTGEIIGAAMKVHTKLGPGLLESAYEKCLAHELKSHGYHVQTQLNLPIKYDTLEIESGYRIDMMVEDCIILELKAVTDVKPIHKVQLLTYLKLSGKKLGLLINFHELHLKDGIKRIIK